MRTLINLIFVLPVGIILLLLAVANRASVVLSLDPFNKDAPAYSLTLPLFAIIFVSLLVGALIGWLATWVGQGRYRRAARLHKREADRLRAESDKVKEAAGIAAGIPAPLLNRR
jgi:uncharacterized integral membrane protein